MSAMHKDLFLFVMRNSWLPTHINERQFEVLCAVTLSNTIINSPRVPSLLYTLIDGISLLELLFVERMEELESYEDNQAEA